MVPVALLLCADHLVDVCDVRLYPLLVADRTDSPPARDELLDVVRVKRVVALPCADTR